MTTEEFKKKSKLIGEIAKKYDWRSHSEDSATYRVSYKDELSIYRIDIYLSRMTVCLLPVGDKGSFFKRQNLKMIEAIFKDPHEFEK